MALSGVGATPEPNGQNQGETKEVANKQQDNQYSIFDKNQDGTVTIAEQQDALRDAAKTDDIIKAAVKKGFDLDMYLNILGEICEDIKTNTSKTIGNFIVTPQQMVGYANRKVQGLIDTIKEKANEFLQPKTQREAPTKMGDGWGSEGEHFDYIYERLQENGIALSKVNFDLLSDILARYDYDMDSDSNGTLTTQEMNQYNDGVSHKYMNKDEQGNIRDTKVLDWIVNKYLEKIKQE